ncbi:MAG: rRNA maturation RNase YbeY [Acidobacteriia bacterium]|nr:rRNA maturation RNase YbeY [Terriglobia bacterium]
MIVNQQRAVRVALRPLETFLQRVETTLGLSRSAATVCLVSDGEMARLNLRYRKKPKATDVLSFPVVAGGKPVKLRGGKVSRAGQGELGDIAIAPAVARRYAARDGRALGMELRILILHGVLHLLGYDHETDRGEMDRLEEKLRRRLGLK